MSAVLLGLIVALALVMAYVNGFHDASNAVSTSITTRTLQESTALTMAALLNVLGTLLGAGLIALTTEWAVSMLGLQTLLEATAGHGELLGAALVAVLLTTIFWDLTTWWFGMPTSTWHAFLAALVGASLVIASAADWSRLGWVLLVSVVGPVLSAAFAFVLMHLVLRLGRAEMLRAGQIRFAQTISAGAVATGHGMNDSRIPLAVVVISGAAAGVPGVTSLSMVLAIAVAVGAGTLMGGHRLIRTLGRRLTDLTAAQGLAAETSSAASMTLGMLGLEVPMSTSQSLASSVVGAGLARGVRHIRWGVAREVIIAWLITPPVCALLGAALAAVAATAVSA